MATETIKYELYIPVGFQFCTRYDPIILQIFNTELVYWSGYCLEVMLWAFINLIKKHWIKMGILHLQDLKLEKQLYI